MQIRFRPLPLDAFPPDVWPQRAPFRADWSSTLDTVQYEMERVGASDAVIEADFSERDIRLDGWPRSDARVPARPGVRLFFESDFGPLKYEATQYDHWQANLRAIALTMQAQRAIERWGATKAGQQYVGWKQLGSGATSLVARGESLAFQCGSLREALRMTHPDAGGKAEDFHAVCAYRDHMRDAGGV